MERAHLARDIVTEHFGDVIGKVAGALLTRDRLLMHELESITELEFLQVKNSLLVLIQHNLVSFIEEHPEGNPQDVQTYYQASVSFILWRLRFPRFLQVAKHRFGDEGRLMVQVLLEHGRLTHDLILQHAAQAAGFELADTMLTELIRQRFVVRVPEAPGPQPAVDISTQLNAARKAKPGAGGDEDEDDGVGMRSGLSNLSEGYREAKPKKRKSKGVPKDPQPKRQNVDPLSGRITDVYWCINPERFNMHFRHEAIIKMVEEKVDATAGIYLRVMFKMIEPYIHSLSDHDSVSVSTTELWQELKKEYSSEDITQHSVLQYLNVMAAEQTILKKTSDVDPCSFAISLLGLSEFLQAKVIESVVQQRFGDLSLRIFRLLRMKKQLEQKGIADLALIPVSETREYLYKMLSCEFVHLQEVPRTADHAPARTFYLWSVRMEHIKRHVVNELYAVLRKMHQRLHHEETFSTDLERSKPLSEKDMTRVIEKLENAILQLDQSLMVLTDFGRERKEE